MLQKASNPARFNSEGSFKNKNTNKGVLSFLIVWGCGVAWTHPSAFGTQNINGETRRDPGSNSGNNIIENVPHETPGSPILFPRRQWGHS